MGKGRNVIRAEKISLKEGLSLVELDKDKYLKKDVNGDMTLTNTQGMQLFKAKGTDCVCCGAKGSFFRKEKTKGPSTSYYCNWHLNLYAINDEGKEVLMTKDHIVAKSLGGEDSLDNYQPMCQTCNSKKGDKTLEEWNKYKENLVYETTGLNLDIVADGAKEHWGLDVDQELYTEMLTQIYYKKSEKVAVFGQVTYHRMIINGKKIVVSHHSLKKDIVGIVSKRELSKLDFSVPFWARHDSEGYNKIREEIRRESVKYYNDCQLLSESIDRITCYKEYKYPGILFMLDKNKNINRVLQKITRNVMKV